MLDDYAKGTSRPVYEGGKVEPELLRPARWDLMPSDRYMWGAVQTVRGCPKHCSFCSVWKTDGQRPRQRVSDAVVREIVELRRRGFRFVALADDNFYPVTLTDLAMAQRRADKTQYETLRALRAERFELMARLAQLPDDMVFYTQITMEAAEDPEFLDAMSRARIKGALVGVEAVTPEGLKDVHKNFNDAGEQLVDRLRAFRRSRRPRARVVHLRSAERPGRHVRRDGRRSPSAPTSRFAQFLMLTPFPGTTDFARVGTDDGDRPDAHRRAAADASLADSAGAPPEGLHAASPDVVRRDPPRHAGGLGSLLQLVEYLAAVALRRVAEVAAGVRALLEALPSDVRQYRYCHRQRPRRPIDPLGAVDCQALPQAVYRVAHAEPGDPGLSGRPRDHVYSELVEETEPALKRLAFHRLRPRPQSV